ncbi:MAG: DUF1304 domain-containing protein [Myxococcota bacterium]
MSFVPLVATWFVAILHFGFFALESVLWTAPTGRKVFGLSAADAETTKVLASNQGAYNAMLAVGLLWSSAVGNFGANAFLLVFVILMGAYGAATVKPRIFLVQSVPAIVALGLLFALGA